MLQRVLEPEALDHLPPDDPAARRSRRDLRRVNAVMGARAILLRALARVVTGGAVGNTAPPGGGARNAAPPLRIVELGCGDGLLMLDIARSAPAAFDKAHLTLLDRQALVDDATRAAYAGAGWRVETEAIDVLDWAAAPEHARRYDLVVANLFLHHFEGAALARVLAGCARRAAALVACEPRRSRFALGASHLVAFVGANAVTRQDAVLSVRAGFVGDELGRAWPGDAAAGDWQLAEYDDGLFTHCFCASRQRSRDGTVGSP